MLTSLWLACFAQPQQEGGVKAWDFNKNRADPINVQYTREQKSNTHCFDVPGLSSQEQVNSLDVHPDGVSLLGASDERELVYFKQVFQD